MARFFRRRGYRLTRRPYSKDLRLNSRKYVLMYGTSSIDPKAAHMALSRGHELYYDPAGRPTGTTLPAYTPPGGTAPITATTRTGYDAAGRVSSTTDARGNVTTYGYDTENNLTSIQDANGHTTS